MSPVSVAYANLLSPSLEGGGGLDPRRIDGDLAERFRNAHEEVTARRASGEMGFLGLPEDEESRTTVQELADSFGQWFEAVVVVGIGGSSLGARAVADALLGPRWNAGTPESRDHYPELHFLENPDPESFRDLASRLDPRRTLFNVVSKSGSTAETLAHFLVLEEIVERAVGAEKARGHFLFTTDPERGVLRELAVEHGMPALSVPSNVGGRFSVFSPVGLLPAAVTGLDTRALLGGAAEIVERCRTPVLARNPAGLIAVLLHAADTELGHPIHVLMPYSDRLRTFALWFQQLWAESLGKAVDRDGNPARSGPTPLAAVGAVDQHSLLQLFMEGPRDKVVLFVRVGERPDPVPLPARHSGRPALAYLGGRSLSELLEAERRATVEALRRAGRPSLTLEVGHLDERSLGGLLMLLQIATVYAGALYGVDPLDQPGVELGKRLTCGLLGRDGHDFPELSDEGLGGRRA